MIRRVVLVSPYALGVFGGVQEQVLSMSRELSRRGVDVLVIAPDASDSTRCDTPAAVRRFGRLLSLPANGSRAPLTLSPIAARAARAAVEEFVPDVVHFHEPFAPLVGWSILRRHETPAVATFHRSGSGPALSLTGPLLRILGRGLDATAAVSESAAATIRQAAGLKPVGLFNGFETDRFAKTPRQRTGETLLVTLGRLEDRKGTRYAIDAVRTHNARGADQWRLVVIGDGPEHGSLAALAAHDEMIVFAGAVDDDQKRAWLRRASALIAPATRGESFGLVLLEAMASETMVVASDISGYREAVSGHGILFAPGDSAALERAVETALTSESHEWIDAARRHAENWSMGRLVDAYEALYESARQRFGSAR